MSDASELGKFTIGKFFDTFKDKTWFAVMCCIILLELCSMPIWLPFTVNAMNKQSTEAAITETMDKRDEDALMKHRKAYEYSQQTYAIAKTQMRDYLDKTKCNYIFLIEYHNGSENPVTGIQFCRFDVTLEVSVDSAPFVPIDKFKDDIVARYDLLMNSELKSNNVLVYSKEEFDKVDKYLSYQLNTIDAEAYAIVNLQYKGKIFASLLFVSCDPYINKDKVYECAWELEETFNMDKYNIEENKK